MSDTQQRVLDYIVKNAEENKFEVDIDHIRENRGYLHIRKGLRTLVSINFEFQKSGYKCGVGLAIFWLSGREQDTSQWLHYNQLERIDEVLANLGVVFKRDGQS